MSNRFVVMATSGHPLYDQLKAHFSKFIDIRVQEPFDNTRGGIYQNAQAIMDFTLLSPEDKYQFIEGLTMQFSIPVISELGPYWGEYATNKYEKLEGAISCAFPSKTECFEYWLRNETYEQLISEFFSLFGKKGIRVQSPGFGFTYPRTIVQIINEAYYAVDEGVASKEDIDRAMLYGVNYPMGPFEWCKHIGVEKVLLLLDQLYDHTKEQRYRASKLLRLEALS